MSQPKWKYVGNIGDRNPFERGGFFVYEDTTGVYEAEAEIYDPDEGTRARIEMPQFKRYPEGLVAVSWINNRYRGDEPPEGRANDEWFFGWLDGVCSFCGIERAEFEDMLCSDDPMRRAFAYRALVYYFGVEDMGGDEEEITPFEAHSRYGNPKR